MRNRMIGLAASLAAVVVAVLAAGVGEGVFAADDGANAGKVLRHVVLFKFKADAPAEQVKAVEEAFCALPKKISAIHAFEWGTDNSPEKLSKGFTHCFTLTFLTEEDRGVYLPHPDHKAFGAMLGPVLEDVLVVDYWAKP